MTTNMEAFQALLEGMRADFLAELPERCDSFDESILALEKSPDDREAFNELYRGVHSLKGSGGYPWALHHHHPLPSVEGSPQ